LLVGGVFPIAKSVSLPISQSSILVDVMKALWNVGGAFSRLSPSLSFLAFLRGYGKETFSALFSLVYARMLAGIATPTINSIIPFSCAHFLREI
jgi:hypothetical protein